MKISKIFSDLNKDLSLIRMTVDNNYSPEILESLHQMGWQEKECTKTISLVDMHGGVLVAYPAKAFTNKDSYQGDKVWYRDLAKASMPDHTPGFLVKFL